MKNYPIQFKPIHRMCAFLQLRWMQELENLFAYSKIYRYFTSYGSLKSLLKSVIQRGEWIRKLEAKETFHLLLLQRCPLWKKLMSLIYLRKLKLRNYFLQKERSQAEKAYMKSTSKIWAKQIILHQPSAGPDTLEWRRRTFLNWKLRT